MINKPILIKSFGHLDSNNYYIYKLSYKDNYSYNNKNENYHYLIKH